MGSKMGIKYDLNKINYIQKGSGKKVLLLHGWMSNIDVFKPVIENLSLNFDVLAIDFPGFGKSILPESSWGIYEYADLVYDFIKFKNFYPTTIIGHSFGGRVAIILGSKYSILVDKLILVDSAGLRPKRTVKYYFKVYIYKLIKLISKIFCKIKKIDFETYFSNLKKRLGIKGSKDYEESGQLREIFLKVVNQDLKDEAKKIKKPTLLIWGEKDDATPIYMAKKLQKLIKDSGIVILENAGHFSFLENFQKFIKVVNYFIGLN